MVVKYLTENIGQERCTKKGIYACLVELIEAGIVEEFDCTSTPRSTETQQQREEHNK